MGILIPILNNFVTWFGQETMGIDSPNRSPMEAGQSVPRPGVERDGDHKLTDCATKAVRACRHFVVDDCVITVRSNDGVNLTHIYRNRFARFTLGGVCTL